ncbi:hypothetical protein A5906_30710 [Bradyrhizobium sacchari]|uniref:Uncharacterized protein n=1 Tax=Bradyrhizobium sacchari TaxID=1399419 RepID=A0A560JS28_9BRAD|nr:hypothetical protein [Bradyrhizobium sacchari]OPY98931.1 hypothetical protein A5906_30710 [Bradyrhizobium sacchari]TWB60414.1 hypothetical protein FBZ94_104639 [Bradyrhizobium sacchari]TWB73776.1 hypothetical protein FBZ95_10526 [Bradyrhizobium sacchari]
MATFIFVHGTFAKSAEWPLLRNALIEASHTRGQEARFPPITWTGKNTIAAREAAAIKISDAVLSARSIGRDEKIFLIGHSHGGSAIAYFLKNHEAAAVVDGCAFLSTPFVAIRPRTNAVGLILLTVFVALNVAGISRVILAHFGYPSLGFTIAVVGILAIVLSARKLRTQDRRTLVVKETIKQQTADVPQGQYLFVRCSGDEAAAALSAVQFLAWLGVKISKVLGRIVRPFSSSSVLIVGIFSCLATLVISSSVQIGLVMLSNIRRDAGICGFLHIISEVFSTDFLGVLVILFLTLGLPCIVLSFLGMSLGVFLTQAVASWAFGWTRLSTGLLVELAIEPVPFGEHPLVHIDWTEGRGLEGIVHSWTYEHPVAVQRVRNWVEASLIAPPENRPPSLSVG